MFPQLTLQSIVACSLANCAKVLTTIGPAEFDSSFAKKTLLLVAAPQPGYLPIAGLASGQWNAHQMP